MIGLFKINLMFEIVEINKINYNKQNSTLKNLYKMNMTLIKLIQFLDEPFVLKKFSSFHILFMVIIYGWMMIYFSYKSFNLGVFHNESNQSQQIQILTLLV